MYKIRIDGITYTGADGFDERNISKRFMRNYSEKVCRFQYLWENVTFFGAIHDYLWNRFVNDGSGYAIDLDLFERTGTGGYELVERKSIQMSTADFDPNNSSVKIGVTDKNYELYFLSYKNQNCYSISTKSRNGTTIDAANWGSYQFFDPLDGTYFTFARGYRVYEVLKHMVAFYSNNNIEFQSDYYFDGEGKDIALFSAIELIEKSGRTAPDISWENLMEDLYICHRAWLYIEGTLDNPIFRIEPEDYGFRDTTSNTIEKSFVNINSVKTVDRMLFSKILTGSAYTLQYDPANDANFKNLLFRGFEDEGYNLEGEYISRGELDLTIKNLIVDSNSIENQIKTNDITEAEYTNASDVFMIYGVPGVVSPTIGLFKYNQYQDLPYYNEPLINSNIIKVHLEGIPDNIVRNLNELSEFEGETTTDIVSVGSTVQRMVVNPQTEIEDPNDIYDLINEWFLTKVSDNILIELDIEISADNIGLIPASYRMYIIAVDDSADLPSSPSFVPGVPSSEWNEMLSEITENDFVFERELTINNEIKNHNWRTTVFIPYGKYMRVYFTDTTSNDETYTIHSSNLKIKGSDFSFELTTDSNVRWRLVSGNFIANKEKYDELVSLQNRYDKSLIQFENCGENSTYIVHFQELKQNVNGIVKFTAFAKDKKFVQLN